MRLLKSWLPVIVWAAVILLSANDSLSSTSTAGWFERTFGFSLGFWPHVVIRKLGGHFFAYALLGLLACRASGSLGLGVVIALVVALADETKQSMTSLRTGSAWDVVLDTCSAFFGALFWDRWSRRRV